MFVLARAQVRPQRRTSNDFDALYQGAGSPAQPDRHWRGVRVSWTSATVPRAASCIALMKAMMPNAAFHRLSPVRRCSRRTRGPVWKYSAATFTPTSSAKAVEDKVVLDLVYEARDIDQRLGSEDKIDAWFDAKTQGAERLAEGRGCARINGARCRKYSAPGRAWTGSSNDIVFDFSVKPRLSSTGSGNALYSWSSSIYEACKYFSNCFNRIRRSRASCAVVTSYNPQS